MSSRVVVIVAIALVSAACSSDDGDTGIVAPAPGPVASGADPPGQNPERPVRGTDPTAPVTPGGADSSAAAATTALFAEISDDEPGCSVAVVEGDVVVVAEAYGSASLERGELLEVGTLLDVASVSKQFTALAVGMLVLDGAVALDDPLSAVVEMPVPPWAGEVTVEQLLNHTSGIPDYIDLLLDEGFHLDEPADQVDALAVLADAQLEARPGARFDYSNSNYILLAEVVAAVDGRDLSKFLDEEIFGPLGLEASMWFPAPAPGLAVSYEWIDGWEVADSPWTQLGDGAVRTTPRDLALFGRTYWSDDPPWREMAALRNVIGADDEGSTYSLGITEVEMGGRLVYSHWGAWSGFVAWFAAVPDAQVALALACNSFDVEIDLDATVDRLLDIWLATD